MHYFSFDCGARAEARSALRQNEDGPARSRPVLRDT